MTRDTWLAVAMMGTENRPPQLEPDTPELLRALADRSPEQVLLAAWAVTALERQAGYRPPPRLTALPAAAPDDTQPACSRQAAVFLEVMLTAPYPHQRLLPECLRVLARKGLRVPHSVLPELLDLLARRKNDAVLAALAALTMGERGRWLAAQEQRWQAALIAPGELPPLDPPSEMDWLKVMEQLEQAKSAADAFAPMQQLGHGVPDIPVEQLTEIHRRVHKFAERVRFKVDYLLDSLDFRYEMLVVLSHEQPAAPAR